jgi:uncharacterized SAM-binding protein YcdF (DUF218 family)
MIYMHKLLPLLVSPLGLIFFLFFLSIFIRSKILIVSAFFVLLICSFPLTAHLIWKSLESSYPYENIQNVERRDAVVVLSGILQFHEAEEGIVFEWGEAADRFFEGVELVKLGKAEKLIFTRGLMPWNDGPSEGELLKVKALKMGLEDHQVLLTGNAANTSDEAKQVKKILVDFGFKNIILVTSSFHMPRAKSIFDHEGIDSRAFAVDYRSDGIEWLDFIPSAKGFFDTSFGIREYMGRLYYFMILEKS